MRNGGTKNPGSLRIMATGLFLLVICTGAMGMSPRSETRIGRNITIEAGESAEELTCLGCSVRIRGAVSGDVTTLGGSIVIEQGGSAGGDVTSIAGDVRLAAGSSVSGDIVAMGGHLRRDSTANVGGDIAALGGAGWLAAIFLVPLIILGGIIALLVWLVQRIRRPRVPVVA